MSNTTKPMRYRLAPRDRTGWVFGLSGTQCSILAGGVLLSGVSLNLTANVGIALVPAVASLVLALGRWNGLMVSDHLGVHLRWLAVSALGLDRWENTADSGNLPAFLYGFELREVPAPVWITRLDESGIGVVVDHLDKTVSATLPVRARRFSLCEPGDQDHILDRWGEALGAFASERGVVRRVIWQERASKATAAPRHRSADSHSAALASYDDLVTERRREAVMHESSITVAVDLRRVSGLSSRIDAGINVLLEELRTFCARLEDVGFEFKEAAERVRSTVELPTDLLGSAVTNL